MQEIHWLGSVTDDLVYLPSRVLPMMLLRPPNIPSSKFKSKLGSTPILSVLTLCNKKREKWQRASMTRISSKTLEVMHYRTTYQRWAKVVVMICTSTKMKLHWLARYFRYEKLKEGMKEKAILSRGKIIFQPYPGNAAEESRPSQLRNVRQIP